MFQGFFKELYALLILKSFYTFGWFSLCTVHCTFIHLVGSVCALSVHCTFIHMVGSVCALYTAHLDVWLVQFVLCTLHIYTFGWFSLFTVHCTFIHLVGSVCALYTAHLYIWLVQFVQCTLHIYTCDFSRTYFFRTLISVIYHSQTLLALPNPHTILGGKSPESKIQNLSPITFGHWIFLRKLYFQVFFRNFFCMTFFHRDFYSQIH